MKLFAKTAFAAAFLGSAALAGSIAPSDVQFGEYGEIKASLTGVAGDSANGRKLFMNRKKGNCLACHVNSEMLDFQGLDGESCDLPHLLQRILMKPHIAQPLGQLLFIGRWAGLRIRRLSDQRIG